MLLGTVLEKSMPVTEELELQPFTGRGGGMKTDKFTEMYNFILFYGNQ